MIYNICLWSLAVHSVVGSGEKECKKYLSHFVIIQIIAIFCFYFETSLVNRCPVKLVGLENTFHTSLSSVTVNYSSLKMSLTDNDVSSLMKLVLLIIRMNFIFRSPSLLFRPIFLQR